MIKWIRFLLVVVTIGFLVGCVHTNMNRVEVVRAANRAAKKEGINLEQYRKPSVKFDASKNRWWVDYEVVGIQYPGSFFTVWVDDSTGKTDFFPGE